MRAEARRQVGLILLRMGGFVLIGLAALGLGGAVTGKIPMIYIKVVGGLGLGIAFFSYFGPGIVKGVAGRREDKHHMDSAFLSNQKANGEPYRHILCLHGEWESVSGLWNTAWDIVANMMATGHLKTISQGEPAALMLRDGEIFDDYFRRLNQPFDPLSDFLLNHAFTGARKVEATAFANRGQIMLDISEMDFFCLVYADAELSFVLDEFLAPLFRKGEQLKADKG